MHSPFNCMNAIRMINPARLWFIGIAAMYLFLLATYADFTPFYDGGIYYFSILRLVSEPFHWELLHMEGHPSPVYTMLMAWSQFIRQGATIPMFATNMVLALFAAWTFYKLLGLLTRNSTTETERMIAAGIYALMPVFVVHLFHINLDVGLSFFFVPYLYYLLKGRPWLATLFGTAMMLTKETGVLVYLLTAGLYLVIYVLRPAGSPLKALKAVMHRWQIFLPGILFGLYFGSFRLLAPQSLAHWGSGTVEKISMFLDFNLNDGSMQSFLFNLYGLNFNWLFSLVLAAYAVRMLWRWSFGLPQRRSIATRAIDALFLVLLLVGITYVTTRVRPWNNARYMLVGYPVLIILAYHCLVELVSVRKIREALLGMTFSLMLLANVATVDPVSRAFYGTIPFGEHQWLDMTSKLGPHWLRRDPQAYNLEFFELHYSTHRALASIRPPENSLIAAGPAADFFFANRLLPDTFRPTLRQEGTVTLRILDRPEEMVPERLEQHLSPEQSHVWYLSLPNLDDNQFLPIFIENYRLAGVQSFGRRGYEVMLHRFERP